MYWGEYVCLLRVFFSPANFDNGGLRERDVFAMCVRCGLGRKVSLVQLNEYGSTTDQNPVVNYYYSWVPSEGFFLHSNRKQNLKWLNLLSKQKYEQFASIYCLYILLCKSSRQ